MSANELANALESNRIKLFGHRFEDAGRAIILYTQSAMMVRSQEQEIEQLKKVLKKIIAISDRKHDAWDEAKNLLKKASEK